MKRRIFFIGESNTRLLAQKVRKSLYDDQDNQVFNLTMGGFIPDYESAFDLRARLDTFELAENDIIVGEVFSTTILTSNDSK